MALIDGFSESTFTKKGKELFVQGDHFEIKVSKFAYARTNKPINDDRVDQDDIAIYKNILSQGRYTDDGVSGYRIDTRLDAYEVTLEFDIVEVGLYAHDPVANKDILVWVGKMSQNIHYKPTFDVAISIYMPISEKDIRCELFTTPKRVSDHNKDLNSHIEVRNHIESNKMWGDDISTQDDRVILKNPLWDEQKVYSDYKEGQTYYFTSKRDIERLEYFQEEGKNLKPVKNWDGSFYAVNSIKVGRSYLATYHKDGYFYIVSLDKDWKPQITAVYNYARDQDALKLQEAKDYTDSKVSNIGSGGLFEERYFEIYNSVGLGQHTTISLVPDYDFKHKANSKFPFRTYIHTDDYIGMNMHTTTTQDEWSVIIKKFRDTDNKDFWGAMRAVALPFPVQDKKVFVGTGGTIKIKKNVIDSNQRLDFYSGWYENDGRFEAQNHFYKEGLNSVQRTSATDDIDENGTYTLYESQDNDYHYLTFYVDGFRNDDDSGHIRYVGFIIHIKNTNNIPVNTEAMTVTLNYLNARLIIGTDKSYIDFD